MHIQLLSTDPSLEILAYILALAVSLLIFAAIMRWVFNVNKFLNNQRIITSTLRDILAELQARNRQP